MNLQKTILLTLLVLFSASSFAFIGKGVIHDGVEFYSGKGYSTHLRINNKKAKIMYKTWGQGKIIGTINVRVNRYCFKSMGFKFLGIDDGMGSYLIYKNSDTAALPIGKLIEYNSRLSVVSLNVEWKENRSDIHRELRADGYSLREYNANFCSVSLALSGQDIEFKGK